MSKKLQVGINDLETWCITHNRQDLLNEWDFALNTLSPNQISYGSHTAVHWRCSEGHSFVKSIHDRCQGGICPQCSGIIFKHRAMLFDERPELMAELDEDYNTFNDVKTVSCCSNKTIHWICPKGHKYNMRALNRSKGLGCPFCSNRRVLVGFNDLNTWCIQNNRLQILTDWDYEKNDFSPQDVTFGSNRYAYFKCHICRHEWKTVISSRTSQGSDCRMCSRRINSSFPEQCIYYYIRKYFDDAINGDKTVLEGKELDIYIPSLSIAIEYDGKTWHSDIAKDIIKDDLCAKKQIILYRIREHGLRKLDSTYSVIYEYDYGDWDTLSTIVRSILSNIGLKEHDVDIVRDEYIIKEQYFTRTLAHSLAADYPDVADEWDYSKNGKITPDLITAQTHDIYSWKCSKCGNSFTSSPHNRVNAGSGCPVCGNKKKARSQSFPVINLDTNEFFISASEAAKKYNVSAATIRICCKGKTKTAAGYHWKYDTDSLTERHIQASTRRARGNSQKQRKVMNIDTGQIYDSLLDAERQTHIHNISAVCRGIRPTAGGYRWKYLK